MEESKGSVYKINGTKRIPNHSRGSNLFPAIEMAIHNNPTTQSKREILPHDKGLNIETVLDKNRDYR